MIEKDNATNIVYFTRLHWIIFVWPVFCFCVSIGLLAYFELDILKKIAYGFAAFTLLWVGMTWVTYYFSSLTIKKNQVIIRTGVIVRQTIDIPLSKIEAIDIRQSIFGSLLSYGMLSITGTGGTRRIINFLSNPLTCRRYIEQLMGEL